ncbi:4a-hydroxytetrahydrobiopterin dehydratase [Pelagibacterales bacterium SAG-MED06]|nr:4a-hydroxytetrahydrobiopterin dehydratase [Pelagibacterales bacterium SAG-MED06]
MSDLLNKKCVPCEGGVLPFDISEIHNYQKKVDGWDISKDEKNIFFLNKKFNFKNFLDSQNFINKVGEISENEGHHPDISFGWGYAEIKITTHAIEGLSENDFILAAKIDQLINV